MGVHEFFLFFVPGQRPLRVGVRVVGCSLATWTSPVSHEKEDLRGTVNEMSCRDYEVVQHAGAKALRRAKGGKPEGT